MGLAAGWADVYPYRVPGNYSHALLEIRGEDITVLERGRGRSPWDPNAVVSTDFRNGTGIRVTSSGGDGSEPTDPSGTGCDPPIANLTDGRSDQRPSPGSPGGAAAGQRVTDAVA